MNNPYYPVALDLRDKPVLVVGGGTIAEGKVEALLESEAVVHVVSPDATGRIRDYASSGRVTWAAREFVPKDAEGAWIVIAATDDRAVNAEVAAAARAAGRLVNAVDDVPNCDFIATSIVRRGALQLSISTAGLSPAMARWLRETLDDALPEELGDLVQAAGDVRAKLKAAGPVPGYAAWRAAIEGALRIPQTKLIGGTVYLVGAGPGDPGLLTLRGLQCLANADAVVHDQLVDPAILTLARHDARIVDVGKQPGQHYVAQAEINARLVELASQGLSVVRLKGGDPFVFGRGGEEVLALLEAQVSFEVVPGVSSAFAAPAAAGIPVTHRGLASAVTIVTGHEDPTKPGSSIDWDALARSDATLVILMGMGSLPRIAERLQRAGKPSDTPVAIIRNATRPNQNVLVATLADVAIRAAEEGVTSPATIVVGDVVAFAERFAPALTVSGRPGSRPLR